MKMDLGKSSEGLPSSVEPSKPSEKHYPSLYIDGDETALADLPESGTMTVTFKRTSHSTHTRDGKTSCNVCLDILSIESVEADDEENETEEPGDALDKAAAAEKAAAGDDE